MTTTPTPEQFLAQTDPDEEEFDYVDVVLTRPPGPDSDFVELEDSRGRGLGPSSGVDWVDRGDGFSVLRIPLADPDPLASIADSLRQLVAATTGDVEEEKLSDRFREDLDDLEAKHGSLLELLEEVRTIIKPSTSKLANTVREAIARWSDPQVAEPNEPEGDVVYACPHCKTGWGEVVDPCTECGRPAVAIEQPAHDADVEEWRAYARSRGYAGPDVDKANRSQIRTMLGIEQPA